MSTPIKPPDRSSPDGIGAVEDGADGGRVEERRGELRSLVDAAEAEMDPATVEHAHTAAQPSSLGAIEHDLAAGRIDVDGAVEQLVTRALEHTGALGVEARAALEAELRTALREDPTLIALQKDLQRGSTS